MACRIVILKLWRASVSNLRIAFVAVSNLGIWGPYIVHAYFVTRNTTQLLAKKLIPCQETLTIRIKTLLASAWHNFITWQFNKATGCYFIPLLSCVWSMYFRKQRLANVLIFLHSPCEFYTPSTPHGEQCTAQSMNNCRMWFYWLCFVMVQLRRRPASVRLLSVKRVPLERVKRINARFSGER